MTKFAEGLESVGYDAVLYPAIGYSDYIVIVIMVVATGIIASIYPAYKALKYDPADAIRSE